MVNQDYLDPLPDEKKSLKFEEKFHQNLSEPPQQPLLL
jgi:hypothetical protein